LLAARKNGQQGNFLGQEMTKKKGKNTISCGKKLPKRQFLAARNDQKGKRQVLAARTYLFDNFLQQEITFLPFLPFPGASNGNKSISSPKKLIYSHFWAQEMAKKAKRQKGKSGHKGDR